MDEATGLVWEFEKHLMAEGLASTTIASYTTDIRLFYKHIGKTPTESDLTRLQFLDYKRSLVSGQAVATVNKKVNSLQAYRRFLKDCGHRADVRVTMKRDRIKVASGSEGTVDVFTDGETDTLLTHVSDESKCSQRNRLIVYLLLFSDLCISELCDVRVADVDRLGATLRVIGKGSRYRENHYSPTF